MIRSSVVLGAAIALAACGGGVKPSAPPVPQVAAAPVASIDTTQPATRDAFSRANRAAAAVDTIIVKPDSVTLRVGQVLSPLTALRIEARTLGGELIPHFAPLIEVRDHAIADFGSSGLTGRRVGRTEMVLSPLSLDPSVPTKPVRAVVIINVVP